MGATDSPKSEGAARIPPGAGVTGGRHPEMPFLEAASRRLAGARILVVDDDPTTCALLKRFCERSRYDVILAEDGVEALKRIEASAPDLVLCDVLMPVMGGIELCRRIKSNPRTALLPVILLSGLTTSEEQRAGLDAGADEYLTKPFAEVEGMARIRAMLRMKFLQDQLENIEGVLFALARAVEARDLCTGDHIERVSRLRLRRRREDGSRRGRPGSNSAAGAVLHDIGKISTPDAVLNKAGMLTAEELQQVQRHPETGEQICLGLKTLQPVLDLIRHHHERPDGSGYPDGLSGDQVTLPVRIMAVCDAYDALTNPRPYHDAMSRAGALQVLEEGARSGIWDREVLRCLKSVTAPGSRRVPPLPPFSWSSPAGRAEGLPPLSERSESNGLVARKNRGLHSSPRVRGT